MSSLDVRAIDVNQLRKQPCPPTKQEFRVFLTEAAFDRAVERGDKDTTREVGGVLVGEVLRDDAGPYLRIDATIDALHAEEKGAELTFTHATWEHIHKEMDGKHQDKRVVGWYHTHPGFGIFLSDRDQFIHKSFFNLPFQVAFVYDPKSHEHGMFAWHENEVWRARRYWIGAREQVWDGLRAPADAQARDHGDAERKQTQARDASRERERAQPIDDASQPTLGTFIVIGVILLLVGGFVGHWHGSAGADQVLSDVQRELDKAKIDGAQQAIGTLQRDVVDLLRDTFSDEALHRPLRQAIATLDQVIASLPADAAPGAPAAGPAGGLAAGPGAPGAPAGSAAPATVAVPPASAPAAAGSGARPGPEGRWAALAAQLKTARETLVQLEEHRRGLQQDLARVAAVARNGNQLPRELLRELTTQRAGLGGVYSELAAQAVKAGDKEHARELLSLAARLDPGNRARYELQLQMFVPSGRLPPPPPEISGTGSADQGAPR